MKNQSSFRFIKCKNSSFLKPELSTTSSEFLKHSPLSNALQNKSQNLLIKTTPSSPKLHDFQSFSRLHNFYYSKLIKTAKSTPPVSPKPKVHLNMYQKMLNVYYSRPKNRNLFLSKSKKNFEFFEMNRDQRSQTWTQKKTEKLQKIKQDLEIEEMKDCTFSPKVKNITASRARGSVKRLFSSLSPMKKKISFKSGLNLEAFLSTASHLITYSPEDFSYSKLKDQINK